ncbi:GbsR/MarR family transcriptional regulator [Pyrococcus sp. ST04]|uniref:GbsR/MarR family transcriptional regulator n=1 Tax=Pyrococcus sp. ST04 TaxID=1183377 RepID=UPI0002605A4F|nr:GbsR/MarR family transcriptional regulator [Pyrococcus sp. ST04]AFK22016.1 putative transcription regulator, MarR family [Pyrococcus sp. ST04]
MGIEEAKKIIMETFANTARRLGQSELIGYIYGALFLAKEPLSLSEISSITGYSLSHVSSAMKVLEGVGLVQRIKKPGDRKAYFIATKNFGEWRSSAFYENILRDIEETRENLLKALKEVENDDSEEAKEIREKIQMALKRNEIAKKLLSIVMKFKSEEELLETLEKCLEKN